MNASPTRKACTPAARMRATSAGANMPLSVTTRRSLGIRGQQVERGLKRDVERAQVAVVDADKRRRQSQRAIELGRVVDFGQYRHPEFACEGLERGEARVVERGDDQQNAIGTEGPRLDDLVFVKHEILAQHRQ